MILVTINSVPVYVQSGDIVCTREEGVKIISKDGQQHFILKAEYKGKHINW